MSIQLLLILRKITSKYRFVTEKKLKNSRDNGINYEEKKKNNLLRKTIQTCYTSLLYSPLYNKQNKKQE